MSMPLAAPPLVLWLLLASGALGLVLFWWHRIGARRMQRLCALERELRAAQAVHGDFGPAWTAQLRSAIGATPAAERASYARPWLLCMGDPAADLAQLLATAQPAGPRPAAADTFWRWWTLERMVAIEVCPPPLAPAAPLETAWLHALRELAGERPRLPLHGLVLCLSTATLRADPEVRDDLLEQVARRACEAARRLQLRLPVHVVVTGLQRLEGFDAMREALPASALARALGGRLPVPPGALPHDAEALDATLAGVLDPIEERLHALRLGLLLHTADARARQGIHLFAQEAAALRPGLRTWLGHLSRHGSDSHVFWRSLHFCAAAPQAAFVDELMGRLLPADQPLARPAA